MIQTLPRLSTMRTMAGSLFFMVRNMRNLKQHASIEDQVALMKSRGLVIQDEEKVKQTLTNVNYYRLSGYLHDFKKTGSDCYENGLTWERLKQIYDFDRKLTRILLYALEDVEETLKTRVSYTLTSMHPQEPLIYLKSSIYRDEQERLKFKQVFRTTKRNNRNLPFVKHHYIHYNHQLPMWVAVELFTMGNLHAMYDNLLTPYQKAIAQTYHTGPKQLSSWIENLTYTRNHLAHYMRIYNFNFGRTPAKCKNHAKYMGTTNMIFDQIYVIACMYSDVTEWNGYVLPEVERIIREYSSAVELTSLGFPPDWVDLLKR